MSSVTSNSSMRSIYRASIGIRRGFKSFRYTVFNSFSRQLRSMPTLICMYYYENELSGNAIYDTVLTLMRSKFIHFMIHFLSKSKLILIEGKFLITAFPNYNSIKNLHDYIT